MSHERLTIFIPVRHFHPGHLADAVSSVFGQTRDDWKLLIVEDPEEPADIRELLAARLADSRVSVIRRQGRGLAAAYNSAMRAADTEFIAALLGDDMLAPDAVECLGDFVRRFPEADFFHTGRYFVDGTGRRISSDYLPLERFSATDFWDRSPVKHLMCWRRTMGLACGGVDETMENFATDDWDFPWTMLEHGAKFVSIQRSLYVFRDHRDGYRLTTHVARDVQLRQLRRILEKHGTPGEMVERNIREAKRSYLRQSLFRNAFERWIKEKVGFDPNSGWRERYH